jgi:hypothetical protein
LVVSEDEILMRVRGTLSGGVDQVAETGQTVVVTAASYYGVKSRAGTTTSPLSPGELETTARTLR